MRLISVGEVIELLELFYKHLIQNDISVRIPKVYSLIWSEVAIANLLKEKKGRNLADMVFEKGRCHAINIFESKSLARILFLYIK